ncbi:acyltransferase [Paraglaciecola sp. 20A4]|uniref:acyltransferase family protein n=1 Tax=Paraglaciecola sp. 20A4 TaxID=2687288 RepID=UPI00140AA9ED|nr:acyltransferase [Paraglaciecola sp. 20A4]
MSTKNYRWDIQGLRALAVMAVVIFHISPYKLPGGYLGVDIFFVISGYLIIGFICRDLRAEKFSLSDFYIKRIRRLFPALLATVIVTMIAAYCYLLPEEMTMFAKSVISTLLYVSNMFFYTQSDYFSADLKLAPLLHTWSLSVEEQFYILFPILLIGIIKYRPKALQLFLGIIAVMSFVLSEYLVRTDPSLAFFISPTRFWQFIVGGLLALNLHKMGLSKSLSNVIGFGGLASLIICLFLYDKTTLFPGINAILPTVATLCVLWAGSVTGVFSGLMALPINRFFGNIS